MKRMAWVILIGLLIGVAICFLFIRRPGQTERDLRVVEWINHPSAHPDWAIQARQRCGTAPFLFPTTGYVGYLWGDTFQPGRQIWTYYTHMADPSGNSHISSQFPPGTTELFIPAGTLLGYQGNYSGLADNPVGVHLNFSIVKDDGSGDSPMSWISITPSIPRRISGYR